MDRKRRIDEALFRRLIDNSAIPLVASAVTEAHDRLALPTA